MATPERETQTKVEGLARVMDGSAITCEGVRDHLEEMNARPELVERISECRDMCRELADELRR